MQAQSSISKYGHSRSVRRIALVLIAAIAIEASAWLVLRTLRAFAARGVVGKHLEYHPVDRLSDHHAELIRRLLAGESSHHRIHSTLGWTARESSENDLYQINSVGIRSHRDFADEPSPGKTRILAFGDSYTFGEEVDNPNTWEAWLEEMEPGLEILNFGVGGYGLDQSYLRYLERGDEFEADIVVIGFLPDNFFRNVNRFRPFLARSTGVPLAKPRFRLDAGAGAERLVLTENPLPDERSYSELLHRPVETLARIGVGDAYYERRYKTGPFDVLATMRLAKVTAGRIQWHRLSRAVRFGPESADTEAFRVSMHLFEEFVGEVERRGDIPVIVLYPPWWDLVRRREGREVSYSTLMEHLDSAGHCYVDLAPAFDALGPDARREDAFEIGHYSARGNRLVAELLQGELRRCAPDLP